MQLRTLPPKVSMAGSSVRLRVLVVVALVVLAAVVYVLSATASATGPTSTHYRLNWSIPIRVKGRVALRAKVYSLSVASKSWTVRVSITNRSGHTLRPVRTGKTGWGVQAVTQAVHAGTQQCTGVSCFVADSSSFSPALPRQLTAGAKWSGLVRGPGAIPSKRWVSVALGYYYGWPRGGFGSGPTVQAVRTH